MDKQQIAEQAKNTAIKLLECVERDAAIATSPNVAEHINNVVDSALMLLKYYEDHGR